MRPPSETERQLATFVLLNTTITGKERLMATRMERGEPTTEDDFKLIRELAQRHATRHNSPPA
jgi:hypothetical protein